MRVTGIALAAGGVSAHAAIVARSLGIPMVIGVGEDLLSVTSGTDVVIDGNNGVAILSPNAERTQAAWARASVAATTAARERLPAGTCRQLRLMVMPCACLRTFRGLQSWLWLWTPVPRASACCARSSLFWKRPTGRPRLSTEIALAPIFKKLDGRPATVRVLDFGGDKTPPFLLGVQKRGIELLLRHRDHLSAQLRAILASGRDFGLARPVSDGRWCRPGRTCAAGDTRGARSRSGCMSPRNRRDDRDLRRDRSRR